MYLTSLVIDEIAPVFQERGFERFPDYAGGSAFAVGMNCVPFQRRSGREWPTVEFLFDKRCRPTFGVTFAMLPEVCSRQTEHGPKDIPRVEANVVEGLAYFLLCKGQRSNFDCNFGCHGLVLRPESQLDGEIAVLKSLLPWLFRILETGIPAEWYKKRPGYVDQHAFLSPGSRVSRST